MSAPLQLLNRRSSQRITPPRDPLPYSQFCPTVILPDGPRVGDKWAPQSEPAQRLWIEAVESGRWRKFINAAPSQRGKTLSAILSPTLWAIAERRSSVGYIMPNLDKLTQNWEGKIKPAIEGTGYGGWLPKKGPGSKGGKPAVLTMRDPISGLVAGRLYFMAMGGGASEKSLSSVSPDVLVIDEADDAESAGQIDLAMRRIQSFGAGSLIFVASTVNNREGRPDHPILDMWAQGTKSRLGHHCPHCKLHVILEMECFSSELAAITCPKCAIIWTEADRHAALNGAILVYVDPESDAFSLLTTGIDYHWEMPDKRTGKIELLLPSIAAEYKRAKLAEDRGDFSLMKVHHMKVWCRHYEPPAASGEINNKHLAERSTTSTSTKRIVPAWVKYLTIGQDPGKHVHYWLTQGHGPDGRWCIVDWGYERVVEYVDGKPKREPTDADHFDTLNLIRDKATAGWQVEGSDRRMRPVQRGVDIGYEMQLVVSWLAGEPEWKAMRGLGGKDHDQSRSLRPDGEHSRMDLAEEIARSNSLQVFRPAGWRQYVYGLTGDVIRHNVHAGLLRQPGDAGSGLIPAGIKANDMLILHLCGEVWKPPELKDGKQVAGYWAHPHGGWDLLDCLRYSHALSILHTYHPDSYDSGEPIMAANPEPEPAGAWLGDQTKWKL